MTKDERTEIILKTTSLCLLCVAVLTFLFWSKKIYEYSMDDPQGFEFSLNQLNNAEQAIAKSMHATGKFESNISLTRDKSKTKGKYNLFEDVSNKHKK